MENSELNDDDFNEEDEESDDELPTLNDMFGYDDPEDNEEAALDYILKIQENS